MSWIDTLKKKWNINSTTQAIVILIVFACTGFTVLFVKTLIINVFLDGQDMSGWTKVFFYVMFPFIYNILLIFYGAVFGQFAFFWNFEKRFFSRMLLLFQNKNKH